MCFSFTIQKIWVCLLQEGKRTDLTRFYIMASMPLTKQDLETKMPKKEKKKKSKRKMADIKEL